MSYDFAKLEEGRGTDTDRRGVLLAEALACAEFSRPITMANDVGHEAETTAVDSGAVELGFFEIVNKQRFNVVLDDFFRG